MLKNLIYPILVILLGAISLSLYNNSGSKPEDNIRITHEFMLVGISGISELISKFESHGKTDGVDANEEKNHEAETESADAKLRLAEIELMLTERKRKGNFISNPVLHRYVIDTNGPVVIDNIRMLTNNFDYLAMTVDANTTILEKGDVIDFNIFTKEKVTFLGFSGVFIKANEGLVFLYNNKEIEQIELSSWRDIELDIFRSWKVKYPTVYVIFEFVTFLLWVCLIILILSGWHLYKYQTDVKYRAMNLSDDELLKYYLVFRHLKEKNPKRMRDVIKMVRRRDPAQLN